MNAVVIVVIVVVVQTSHLLDYPVKVQAGGKRQQSLEILPLGDIFTAAPTADFSIFLFLHIMMY